MVDAEKESATIDIRAGSDRYKLLAPVVWRNVEEIMNR